jgi:CIC family chloride channel protein
LLAGVVHCPITAFLLLFEITGSYSIILPLMVSCPVSTLVAKLFREESIYTLQLLRRGIDVRRREENIMRTFTVGHVMRQDVPTLQESTPFAEVVQHFLTSDIPVCFVVDQERRLVGEISIHDVKALLQEDSLGSLVIARDLLRKGVVTTTADETLARCLEKFSATDQEYFPVVSQTMELQGLISHRDVLELYNREILRHEYLGLSLRAEQVTGTVHEQVRLPHEYTVEVMQVPPPYIGKTLRETQLRVRFNITVVAVRRGGFHNQDELPNPDQPFAAYDHLVLVGRPTDLQRFTNAQERENRPGES